MGRGNVLFALVLALALATAAPAQDRQIRGKVRSVDGAPLANAIVELTMSRGGVAETVTGAEGEFFFSGLPADNCEIRVILSGYQPGFEFVRLDHPQGIFNVEIILRPKIAPIFVAGSLFAQDVPEAAREAYKKGIARLRQGRSVEGLDLLRRAIDIFDSYFDAHLALGAELCRIGRYNEAIKSLKQARRINDREGATYHLLGLAMANQQRFIEAEYVLRRAVRLSPDNAASHFYYGLTLIELAARNNDEEQRAVDLAEAEKALTRAWELSRKKLAEVHLHLARIHDIRGEREDAVRCLENYLKFAPEAGKSAAIREMMMKLRSKAR